MPRQGQVVAGRFEIVRILGEGGFGAVYLARDVKAGGEVALKVLDPAKSADHRFSARFSQEVLVVRNLKHHNTIKVYDVGTTESGCLFMAMEYVAGESLAELSTREGGLSEVRTIRITSQILRSLSEAHSMGIIHRDLKPNNVMVCQLKGEADYVKVLDFGISKALTPELSRIQTQTSEMMCTPAYAAPELIRGKRLAPSSDLYSLGLMMIEMITGAPSYSGLSIWEVIHHQVAPSRWCCRRWWKAFRQQHHSPRRREGPGPALCDGRRDARRSLPLAGGVGGDH
jgi:serine/threonine-protein kinase